jgi:tRNA1(Val) A37 N6-methylase TrmN6
VTAPQAATLESHTVDAFLGGLVTLVQPAKGHRAGLDAALLQALVPAGASGHAIDLGAGVGTVAFSIAARAAALTVIGVERDRTLVQCAQDALQSWENRGFAARVRIVAADVTERREQREALGLADASADWVLMNPPFDIEGSVRTSPDDRRRSAHVSDAGGLSAWCRTAAGLLKPGGTLCLIHRAQSLREVLEGLAGRFGEARITPVHPSAERPARRILVAARRGSRGGPQLMPGLVLHRADGSWTGEADAILRGKADLAR